MLVYPYSNGPMLYSQEQRSVDLLLHLQSTSQEHLGTLLSQAHPAEM